MADPSTPPKRTPLIFRVPLDKNEGVVKRHLFAAMLCSTAWISERWRTEACLRQASSETRTVNQFSAVVPPTIDSASTATMILLSEPSLRFASHTGRERPINPSV